jgi:hypothetical protein
MEAERQKPKKGRPKKYRWVNDRKLQRIIIYHI